MATFSSVNGRTITLHTFPSKVCCGLCGKKCRLVDKGGVWFAFCEEHGEGEPFVSEIASVIDWEQAKAEAEE